MNFRVWKEGSGISEDVKPEDKPDDPQESDEGSVTEIPEETATVVLSCEAGSLPFRTRYLRLRENVPVFVGRHLPQGGQELSRNYPHINNGLFDCKVLSRKHASITFKHSSFYLKDLDSSNGTSVVVDCAPVHLEGDKQEVEVFSQDVVQFGQDVVEPAAWEGEEPLVHKCIIAKLRMILPSGRSGRERTKRDLRQPQASLSPPEENADALLAEIRNSAQRYFAHNHKGAQLMKKLEKLEKLLVVHNNETFEVRLDLSRLYP